jgi:hypothetical protein
VIEGKLQLLVAQVCRTQIAERRRIFGVDEQCRADQYMGRNQPAFLQGYDAQQVHRIKMFRRFREDLFVALRGLGHAAGLMQRYRFS